MRNLLLGTSALIVAGTMFAGPAMAQNKPISLGLGGYFNYAFGVVSQDDGVGQAANGLQDHGFLSDGEIFFSGSTTLDNGLVVGVRVELETTTSADQIDETYMFFRSAQFGEIRIGQDDSAANSVTVTAPGAVARFGVADSANVFVAAPTGHRGGTTVDPEGGNFTSDSEKVTYWSPRIAGLQIGISYTADGSETGARAVPLGSTGATGTVGTIGAQEDVWEFGVSYNQTFQGVGVALQGGYSKGTNERAGAIATGAFTGQTADDRTEWALGGQLSYMGFTVGGGYRNDDNGVTGNNETDVWVAGIMYQMGPWKVSLGYGVSQTEAGAGFTGEDETTTWELAVNYDLGPGIEVYAGVVGFEYTNNADAATGGAAAAAILDNDTTTFFVGSRLVF